MNAPMLPNDPERLDELVSAYIEGEAAPDEIAMVEASDDLMAQVESMRSITTMLGAPVEPPSDTMREDHLAAALGESDQLFGAAAPSAAASGPAGGGATAPVTSLAEARERKRPRRLNMVAAAAAAVAILFAGIVAVGLNTGGETTDVVAEAASDAAEPATAAIESRSELVLPEAEDAAASTMADDAMDDDDRAIAGFSY